MSDENNFSLAVLYVSLNDGHYTLYIYARSYLYRGDSAGRPNHTLP